MHIHHFHLQTTNILQGEQNKNNTRKSISILAPLSPPCIVAKGFHGYPFALCQVLLQLFTLESLDSMGGKRGPCTPGGGRTIPQCPWGNSMPLGRNWMQPPVIRHRSLYRGSEREGSRSRRTIAGAVHKKASLLPQFLENILCSVLKFSNCWDSKLYSIFTLHYYHGPLTDGE